MWIKFNLEFNQLSFQPLNKNSNKKVGSTESRSNWWMRWEMNKQSAAALTDLLVLSLPARSTRHSWLTVQLLFMSTSPSPHGWALTTLKEQADIWHPKKMLHCHFHTRKNGLTNNLSPYDWILELVPFKIKIKSPELLGFLQFLQGIICLQIITS